jgi:hypothetical protein
VSAALLEALGHAGLAHLSAVWDDHFRRGVLSEEVPRLWRHLSPVCNLSSYLCLHAKMPSQAQSFGLCLPEEKKTLLEGPNN